MTKKIYAVNDNSIQDFILRVLNPLMIKDKISSEDFVYAVNICCVEGYNRGIKWVTWRKHNQNETVIKNPNVDPEQLKRVAERFSPQDNVTSGDVDTEK